MSAALTVRLDDATIGALDRLAEKTERPRDALVAQAIEDYVALNAWAIGKIEVGLAAADDGDFVNPAELARLRAKFVPSE